MDQRIVVGVFALVIGLFCLTLALGVRKGEGIVMTWIWAIVFSGAGIFSIISGTNGCQ